MKTLVLINNLYTQYGLDGVEENDILFLPMMKHDLNNKLIRAIRKWHMSLPIPFKHLWLYEWTDIIVKYSTIILADTGNTYKVSRYIHKKWPQKRIIIWYRNSVSAAMIHPTDIDRNVCELWSFDKNDCKKYNMKYNPQFYMRNKRYSEHMPEYDAFFVGQEKGRIDILNEMKKEMEREGIKAKFCIVGINSERLSYDEVLEYISRSKAIIDCQCDWQEGTTLRPLEAVFYKKKLITNNLEILSAPYYNGNNIFIWGRDKTEKLREFLASDYEDISREMIKEYDLVGWVRRFEN